MKIRGLRNLPYNCVLAMYGPYEGDSEDKDFNDSIFFSVNNQKKAVRDLVHNMRFFVQDEFDVPMWDKNTPVWEVLNFMLEKYREKSEAYTYKYGIDDGEYTIREVYPSGIDSYMMYCADISFVPKLKKLSRPAYDLICMCLSALSNEKGIWLCNSPVEDSYSDDNCMIAMEDAETEKQKKELIKEGRNITRGWKFSDMLVKMKGNSARIFNILDSFNPVLKIDRFAMEFAVKTLDILTEPHDVEFFDVMSFNAQFNEKECEDYGFPVMIREYIKFIWGKGAEAYLNEYCTVNGGEFGQVMPAEIFEINKKTERRTEYGFLMKKISEFMEWLNENEDETKEMLNSDKLINIL